MKEIDKIAFIETRDGKILSTRSKGKTKYYIPGGKRDAGETDEQALVREVKEELNVAIDPKTIAYVGTFKAQADGAQDGVLVKMTCYRAAFEGELEASSEIDEIRWLTCADMELIAPVDVIIFNFLKDRGEMI